MNPAADIIKAFHKAMDKTGRPGVIIAAYLFGSFSRRESRPDSDIDLAFLLDEKTHKSDAIIAMSPAHLIAARVGMQLDRERMLLS